MAGAMLLSLGVDPGCRRSAGTLDKWEERDPLLKRALARKQVQDIDGAIDLCTKALERKPDLARAHLELGYLYDSARQDYVRAIYHYERYIELRPDAQKKKLIEDLIYQAKLSFAASLPVQPEGAVEEITILKREIDSLKSQLKAQRQKGASASEETEAAPAKGRAAKSSAPITPPTPAPPQPAVGSYVVQPGDTLSSIASSVYKDSSKWQVIYEANRGTLSSAESVRAGQTLIIPPP
jgi:tetratricopeptide (TPR) repeat protein